MPANLCDRDTNNVLHSESIDSPEFLQRFANAQHILMPGSGSAAERLSLDTGARLKEKKIDLLLGSKQATN